MCAAVWVISARTTEAKMCSLNIPCITFFLLSSTSLLEELLSKGEDETRTCFTFQ